MKINYCLPIIKKSRKEVLDSIAKYRNDYQYLEIWLDSIKDIDKAFVDQLIYMLQNKLILLFHRGSDIKPRLSSDKKREILDLLDNSKSFIDLDLSEKDELAYLKKINVKTIISYHNYDKTPDDLNEITKQIGEQKPTIYKISTLCKNENDAIRLLHLQVKLMEQKQRCIVLGMGKFGTITRVFGTMWGNEMIYAPVKKEDASAPGQLTKNQLENILGILIPSP